MATATRRRTLKSKLTKGSYLTDGTRLVEVRRVRRDGELIVEECDSSVEDPILSEIPAAEVAAGHWRIVELVELDA